MHSVLMWGMSTGRSNWQNYGIVQKHEDMSVPVSLTFAIF